MFAKQALRRLPKCVVSGKLIQNHCNDKIFGRHSSSCESGNIVSLRFISSKLIGDEFNAIEDESRRFPFRNILYSNSKDDVILTEISDLDDPEKILTFYSSNKNIYKKEHFVQSVVLLWDFYRNGRTLKTFPEDFLQDVRLIVKDMNSVEVSCCYLYLKKMNIHPSHGTMEALLQQALDSIHADEDVPLSALSRLCLAVGSKSHFHIYLVCKDLIPLIENYLNRCDNIEDLRLITICLQNLILFVSDEFLEDYVKKIEDIIQNTKLDSSSAKSITKILNFLNRIQWSLKNTAVIRKLMDLVCKEPEHLTERDLEAIFRVYQAHMEPAIIGTKLLPIARKMLEATQSLSMLSYVAQFSSQLERESLTKIFKESIRDHISRNVSDLYSCFQILRTLKISDNHICNMYWDEALKEVLMNVNNNEISKAFKHCHRYMHFNNNLGGTYRHTRFEQKVSAIAVEELRNGLSGLVPTKFAQFASFVLAYGHTNHRNYKFPDFIVRKIEDMSEQFSMVDVFNLSRGIFIALEIRFRRHVGNELAAQLVKIENITSDCIERHLQNRNLNLNDVSMIARSMNNLKFSKNTQLYKTVIEKFSQIPFYPMNSRLIKDITFNLNTSHFSVPPLMNKIFSYISENKEFLTGETVEKVLFSSYSQGILNIPTNTLKACLDIIRRDFDKMPGLSIVQSCLALCLFRSLPEDLINKVFSVDFVKRIEDEIRICYSKTTYPEKVFNQVMQLNRAVCLEFPEASVPWFQQTYLESHLSRQPARPSKINDDVKSYLKDIIKDDKYLRVNHVTPYGYRIDFLIHFDRNKQPIQPPAETTFLDRITKVAILLLKLDSFCENDVNMLRGVEHLKTRHLEMMGYKVVHINVNDWNSMYMNVPGVKKNYLKCLLQISDS